MNPTELLRKITDISAFTDDEREALRVALLKPQYGLVWEDKPEEAEKLLIDTLPVLDEVPALYVPAQQAAPVATAQQAIAFEDNAPAEKPDCNHILIEGDNLHALTALTYTHENKIDVIY